MSKKLFIAVCLLLSLHVQAQKNLKCKHPQRGAKPAPGWLDSVSNYYSNLQVEELTHNITKETFSISFNETTGYIAIFDF